MGIILTTESGPVEEVSDPNDFAIEVTPAATRRHITEELDGLTAKDVFLSGRKKDGTVYRNRRLDNISFRRTAKGSVVVEGYDPAANGVRTFDLADLVDIRERI